MKIWIREFELNNRNRPRLTGFIQGYKFVHALPEPGTDDSRAEYAEAWLALGTDAIVSLIREGMDASIDAALAHLRDNSLVPENSARFRIPDYSNRVAYQLRREKDDLLWLSLRPTSNEIIIVHRDAAVSID